MDWVFTFKKNVYMYSHELKCMSGKIMFYCQSEDSAEEDNVVLFWLDDIPLKAEKLLGFASELEKWCKKTGV